MCACSIARAPRVDHSIDRQTARPPHGRRMTGLCQPTMREGARQRQLQRTLRGGNYRRRRGDSRKLRRSTTASPTQHTDDGVVDIRIHRPCLRAENTSVNTQRVEPKKIDRVSIELSRTSSFSGAGIPGRMAVHRWRRNRCGSPLSRPPRRSPTRRPLAPLGPPVMSYLPGLEPVPRRHKRQLPAPRRS